MEILNSIALNKGDGYKWSSDGPTIIYSGEGLETIKGKFEKSFLCPLCGTQKMFDLCKVFDDNNYYRKWWEALGNDEFEKFAQRMKLIKDDSIYGISYETVMDFSPWLQALKCNDCTAHFIFSMGYGEQQPSRFLAIDYGVFMVGAGELPSKMNVV